MSRLIPDMKLSDLWRLDKTIGRVSYATVGMTAFAIKYGIDRLIAGVLYGREWSLLDYWISPFGTLMPPAALAEHHRVIMTLLFVALPFIWLGVVMTIRRLNSIGWPPWMVILFFYPFLNLVFFFLLCTLRSTNAVARPLDYWDWLDAIVPRNRRGAAIVAALLSNLIVAPMVWFATVVLQQYGWGLFVGLPFSLGLFAVLIDGVRGSPRIDRCIGVSTWALMLGSLSLFVFGLEGIICIAMVLPLAGPLTWMGAIVGYFLLQRLPEPTTSMHVLPMLVLVVPAMLWMEQHRLSEPQVFSVSSSVQVDASPEKVWRWVVFFDELPEPRDWVFRMGIAYPIRAEIDGTGVGAVRHCVFSTGVFVEPIEVWDEPRLLKFSVTSTPDPLEELTFYEDLRPPHLDGFFVAEGGQFLLESDSEGGTSLIGTTWYRQELWPAFYWRWVSNALIHRIHLRVLHHIKQHAESDLTSTDPDLTGG